MLDDASDVDRRRSMSDDERAELLVGLMRAGARLLAANENRERILIRGKDRVDVERLVQVRPQLDRAYIRRRLVDDLGDDDERVAFWDAVVARYPA